MTDAGHLRALPADARQRCQGDVGGRCALRLENFPESINA